MNAVVDISEAEAHLPRCGNDVLPATWSNTVTKVPAPAATERHNYTGLFIGYSSWRYS